MLRSDKERCRIDQRDIEKLTPQERPLWPYLLAALLVALAWWVAGCGVNPAPGSGRKIGQIVRLNQEGIFCKTWEGQLIRGGMTSGSGAFGVQPFDFTISDPLLVAKMQRYLDNQTEVVITYRREGVYWYCRSGSAGDFLVTAVKARQ